MAVGQILETSKSKLNFKSFLQKKIHLLHHLLQNTRTPLPDDRLPRTSSQLGDASAAQFAAINKISWLFQTSKYINKQLSKSHSRVNTSEIAITNVPRSEKGFPARQLLFSVLYADISCHGRPSLPPQLWSAQMADGFMLTLATARVCCCLFLQTRHKNSLSSNFPTLVLSC